MNKFVGFKFICVKTSRVGPKVDLEVINCSLFSDSRVILATATMDFDGTTAGKSFRGGQ